MNMLDRKINEINQKIKLKTNKFTSLIETN